MSDDPIPISPGADGDADSDGAGTQTQLIEVSILRIPVAIWSQTQQHLDEVLREFTLMAAQLRESPEKAQDVPVRLIQLVEELTENFGGLNTDQENRLAAAA